MSPNLLPEQATKISPERQLAHAQALRARGSALPPEGLPQPEILDSWVRCMRSGLDASLRMTPPVLEDADLARRRQRWAMVRRLAQVELETLAQQIAGSNFLLAYADPDGVILDLYQDNRFSMSQDGAGIVAGSCWNETLAGTNGLGTALAAGHSVAVTGLEHYYLQLGQISCTATPVHDACGEVVGVLDASSYFESRQRHTQALVQMAATQIENRLMVQQLQQHWVFAFHPRAEYLGTLSAGLLAFSEEGRLQALNARARQMLPGLHARPGVGFDELFDEPFVMVAARLARQGELRLRDRLGSALSMGRVSQPASVARITAMASGRPAQLRAAAQRGGPGAHAAGHGATALTTSTASTASAASAASAASPTVPTSATAPVPAVAAFAPVRGDAATQAAYRLASRAARLGVPVLIHGETGSGKELLARHVHEASGRAGPFVAVNCGAIPAELFEAELFGYAGGAYTGSRREGSLGLIASADGGTLLLDEIRELPLGLQAGLLRFLDDRQVRPVGSTQARSVDVQLVAATHADLEAEVAAKAFRADLMYRLNTVRVELPPLREREDFADCVRAVLDELEPMAMVAPEALHRLRAHHWPGNFRELRAVLTRALLAMQGEEITLAEVLPAMGTQAVHAALAHAAAGLNPLQSSSAPGLRQRTGELVRRELQHNGGSISETARVLGISRTTVYRYLRGPEEMADEK